MKKVVLEYDDSTGQLYDKDGLVIGNWMNLDAFDGIDIKSIVDLKEAGFNTEEIIQLRKKGLI